MQISFPTAKLQTGPEFASVATAWIRQLLALIDALLALAVLIALFGVINTLTLSVYERTRELGLLRAIGMSRAQVRATVRYEAATVSLFGTITGSLIGVGSSAALMHALKSQGLDRLSAPVLPLVAVLAVGAVAGGSLRDDACPPCLPSQRVAGTPRPLTVRRQVRSWSGVRPASGQGRSGGLRWFDGYQWNAQTAPAISVRLADDDRLFLPYDRPVPTNRPGRSKS